jgi:hypothetical protein
MEVLQFCFDLRSLPLGESITMEQMAEHGNFLGASLFFALNTLHCTVPIRMARAEAISYYSYFYSRHAAFQSAESMNSSECGTLIRGSCRNAAVVRHLPGRRQTWRP